MRRVLVVLALLAAPAAAQARVVAALAGPVAGLSAWNGHAVFSQLDPASEHWSLFHATANEITRLRVAPQKTPFEADAGSDREGRPVAVFSRCPGLAGSSRCRITVIRLDLPGARPRVVRVLRAPRYSDGAPTVWRGRIAFGRVIDGGTMAAVFLQKRPGSRRLRRLARGTIPACPPEQPHCFRVGVPVAMDLGASGLAFVWRLEGGNAFAQTDQELWAVPLDGAAGRLLDVGGAGECGFGGAFSFRLFGSPALRDRRVSYLARRGDCWLTHSTFTRSGLGRRTRRERASGPDPLVYEAARDRSGWWWVRGPRMAAGEDGSLSSPCGEGRCELVHGPRRLRRVEVPRPPRPPIDTSRS